MRIVPAAIFLPLSIHAKTKRRNPARHHLLYHMRRVDARHATRHDSEATGRYAAYAPTRKRLNTPTTAHSSSTTRHARENHPVHAADGLASAKCVLGGVGVRKAARRAYSESTVSSAPSATSPTPSLSAASTLALDTSTRSTPARSASTTLTPRISNSRRNTLNIAPTSTA